VHLTDCQNNMPYIMHASSVFAIPDLVGAKQSLPYLKNVFLSFRTCLPSTAIGRCGIQKVLAVEVGDNKWILNLILKT